MVALLSRDFAILPLKDALYFPVPLNLDRLCVCFDK